MPLGVDLDLLLPRDNSTVPLVRHILRHTLTEFGVSNECVADVELAITEASANVIDHAHGDDEYEVKVTIDERRCQIRVIDAGAGFDRSAASNAFPTGPAERGRGILLMQALMDSIEFESQPEQGTIVHLVKELRFDDGPLRAARAVLRDDR